jgi:hypothetical protein
MFHVRIRAIKWTLGVTCARMGSVAVTYTLTFMTPLIFEMSRLSSGSIVSDYGLDDRAIGVRSPAGAKDFSIASLSRPALGPTQPPVQWVPGVLSPGLKRGLGVTLTTHPHLVPRSSMSRSYTSSPPSTFMECSGTAFIFEMESFFIQHSVLV